MSTLPAGSVPIIYLPGVGRATLRATEDCPHELKPLAELQYRGVIWSQANAKDWTVAAYLQTEKGGLNLTVARDEATATSLRRALEKLADAPLADLQAKSAAGELNGHYFDSLVSDDLVDDLLSWLSHPKETRNRWEPGRWETLCSRCLADYGFDPARDGELVGAEKLGTQPKAVWKTAWKRYAVAPARYPGAGVVAQEGEAVIERLAIHPPRRILAAGQRGRGNRVAEGDARVAVGAGGHGPPDFDRPGTESTAPPAVGVGQAEPVSAGFGHRSPGDPGDGDDHAADRGDAGRHGEGVH